MTHGPRRILGTGVALGLPAALALTAVAAAYLGR